LFIQKVDYTNNAAVAADPSKFAGYLSTDSDGMGYFTDFADRPFIIVHNSAGSRVSCGLLDHGKKYGKRIGGKKKR
jgi:hypothetical protein